MRTKQREPRYSYFTLPLFGVYVGESPPSFSLGRENWTVGYSFLQDRNSDNLEFNPCYHKVFKTTSVSASNRKQVYNPTGDSYVSGTSLSYIMNEVLAYGFLDDHLNNFLTETEWEALGNTAFEKMCPKIKSDLNILNFIYELKDLSRMIQFWTKRASFLRNLVNQNLNANFGWRPFLKDVVAMLKVLTNVEKVLTVLSKGEHKVHTRHWRTEFELPDFVGRNEQLPNPESPWAYLPPTEPWSQFYGGVVEVGRYLGPIKYHATMKFTYIIPDLRELHAKLNALLDGIGVYWDPQTIWNALPFSFVLDWFFGVGDFLHQAFSRPNFKVDVRIMDFCHSIKAKSEAHTYLMGRGVAASNDPVEIFGEFIQTGTLYWRRLYEPDKDASLLATLGWRTLDRDRIHLLIQLMYATTHRSKPRKGPKGPKR